MESKLTFINEKKYRLSKIDNIPFFFYLHIFFLHLFSYPCFILFESEVDNVKLTLFKLFSSGWQFGRINLHNEKSLKLFSTSLFFIPSHRGDFRDFPVCAESDLKLQLWDRGEKVKVKIRWDDSIRKKCESFFSVCVLTDLKVSTICKLSRRPFFVCRPPHTTPRKMEISHSSEN